MLQRLQIPVQLDGNVWRYSSPAEGNRRHRHAELELNLVVRGSGTYLLGGRRYEIRRGDLLWLFPDQEHLLFEQSSDFSMWVLVFRRRAIRKSATDESTKALLRTTFHGDVCRKLKQKDLLQCEELFVTLSAAAAQPSLLNAGLGYSLVAAWNCFQRAAEVTVREMHPGVERAVWLISNRNADGRLEDMAREVGLSPARLSRLFKLQMGIRMVDFRNRRRVERFFDIYRGDERQTMLSAALEAGFGSYAQFHRVFRRVMGHSPSEQSGCD